jgi:hypothetical protein
MEIGVAGNRDAVGGVAARMMGPPAYVRGQ